MNYNQSLHKIPTCMNSLNIQLVSPNSNKLLTGSNSLHSLENIKTLDNKPKIINNPLNLRSGSINVINGKKIELYNNGN